MQSDATFSEDDFREQAKKDGVTHISTGVAIVRDGKILMARRSANDFLGGVYELPGGGVNQGETIVEGALREVKEETGLTVARVITNFEGFDYSTDRKPHVRQVNFLVETEPGEVILNPKEHDDYAWVDNSNIDGLNMSESMHVCVNNALNLLK